ncbi:MAG: adenylate kinase [Ignavibacteriales bacterium]|nr:adenylate kinase [Ignavibacteriales bacterium]
MKKQLLIFGAPGVGKGTQAKLIADKLEIAHISTGDILREAVSKETEMGKLAKVIMEKGELVPDNIMIGIVRDTLKEDKCSNGYILDGFPRTVKQAEMLDEILKELNSNDICLINIEVDNKLIIQRLSNRKMCTNCGSILSIDAIEEPERCPKCKAVGKLIKRKDDEVEVIKNRLEIYHNLTEPVLSYYKKKSIKIISVDGSKTIGDVNLTILRELKGYYNI